jgi:hypothetical protein
MIAILFSFEQKKFRVETMDEYMHSNIIATAMMKDYQFRLIAIAPTIWEADQICDRLIKKEPYKTIVSC